MWDSSQFSTLTTREGERIGKGLTSGLHVYITIWIERLQWVTTAYVRKAYDCVEDILHFGWMPLRFWGPRLKPAKPVDNSGTVSDCQSIDYIPV